jgi:hypothetical protein
MCGDDCYPCGTAAATDGSCSLRAGAVRAAAGLLKLRGLCAHVCLVHSVSMVSQRVLTTGAAQRPGMAAMQRWLVICIHGRCLPMLQVHGITAHVVL